MKSFHFHSYQRIPVEKNPNLISSFQLSFFKTKTKLLGELVENQEAINKEGNKCFEFYLVFAISNVICV